MHTQQIYAIRAKGVYEYSAKLILNPSWIRNVCSMSQNFRGNKNQQIVYRINVIFNLSYFYARDSFYIISIVQFVNSNESENLI